MLKKYPIQSAIDFLNECGLKGNTLEGVLALKFRELLAENSQSSITKPEQILSSYRIEDELNLNHMDSINIVDIVLELESYGVVINQTDIDRIFNIQEKNATIAEITNELLDIIKKAETDN